MMDCGALQPRLDRAEDRALLRSTPSAVPGAKTGVGVELPSSTPLPVGLPPTLLRDWRQSAKPWRHDAATLSAGCVPFLANANHPTFQFTVNQDTATPDQPVHFARGQMADAEPAASGWQVSVDWLLG